MELDKDSLDARKYHSRRCVKGILTFLSLLGYVGMVSLLPKDNTPDKGLEKKIRQSTILQDTENQSKTYHQFNNYPNYGPSNQTEATIQQEKSSQSTQYPQ
ncbi:MAG: hypothetical protein KKG60_03260 [Nanoarchaeota archaeon]|nr:hypothetical protein [Nanoarchaeota archaeon]